MRARLRTLLFATHSGSILIITLFIMISFPDWLMHTVPALDDLTRLNLPQRIFAATAWLHGQIPLWNPYNFAGQAFLSAGQAGVFYLPNAMFILFHPVVAFKVSYIFHELLGAIGGYYLAFHWVKHKTAAIVTGIGFATCGFLIGHQIHTQMFDAICWLPILFYLAIQILTEPRLSLFTLFAICFAGEIYAGHPQITFYILIFLGLYLALFLIHFPNRVSLTRIAWALASMLMGIGLGAMQWLPTVMAIQSSNRASSSSSFLLSGSMKPIDLSQWLTPFAAGGGYTDHVFSSVRFASIYQFFNYWEISCYTGLILFLLAMTAIFVAWHRYEVRILTCLLLFFVNLSLGENSFLKFLLIRVPGFDLFRIPARYIGLVDFILALLAPFALTAWFQETSRSKVRHIFTIVSLAAAVIISCLVKWFHSSGVTPIAYILPLSICVILPVVIHLARYLLKYKYIRLVPYFLAYLAALDCAYTAFALSPLPYQATSTYVQPSTSVQFLHKQLQHADPFTRVLADPSTSLGFDQSSAYQIPTVNGYDSLESEAYEENINATWDLSTLSAEPRNLLDELDVAYEVLPTGEFPGPTISAKASTWSHTFSNLPNGYVALQVALSPSAKLSLEQQTTDDGAPLVTVILRSGQHTLVNHLVGLATTYAIEIPNRWPRTKPTTVSLLNISQSVNYDLDSVEWMTTGLDIYQRIPVHVLMGPKEWKPVHIGATETVWKNPDRIAPYWSTSSLTLPDVVAPSRITRTSFTLTKQSFRVTEPKRQWLILSQSYDKGWQARVDGHKVTAVPVDRMITGVPIPKGTHDVVLTYIPVGFPLGIGLSSLVALVLAISFILHLRVRYFKTQKDHAKVA